MDPNGMCWHRENPRDVEGWCDQNVDTGLLPHGCWALSKAEDRQRWVLHLWRQNEDLDEIVDEPHIGTFPTEDAAKASAHDCERRKALPAPAERGASRQ